MQDLYTMLSRIFQGLIKLVHKEEPKINRICQDLKEKNKRALLEATSAMEKSEKLAEYNEELIKRWEEDLKNFHKEKLKLMDEIGELEKENKLLLEKIIKSSKKKIKENQNFQIKGENAKPFPKEKKKISRKVKNEFKEAKKTIKLTWLQENIEDLYRAKKKQDQKVRENWARRLNDKSEGKECLKFETMEQFMYSHLKMRYGLKGLIIDQVEQIIQGIKTYKETHVNILLFGKILRNEVDEQYRLAQANIRQCIRGTR